MNKLTLISTQTPDGLFHIIADSDDIARVSGYGDVESLRQRLPPELQPLELHIAQSHPYEASVKDYYAGDLTALDTIPRAQDGSDFQKRVWQAISAIPHGRTISYKQLADQSGNAAAIRAAGTICGLNRLILLVPCHRVLKSDGTIGSYLYGSVIKESLLRHENAIA